MESLEKFLTKDEDTIKDIFSKAMEQNKIIEVTVMSNYSSLEVLAIRGDYAVVKVNARPGVIGKGDDVIHPFGSNVGYRIR